MENFTKASAPWGQPARPLVGAGGVAVSGARAGKLVVHGPPVGFTSRNPLATFTYV